MEVTVVVAAVMVEAAQADAFVEVGRTAAGPQVLVVRLGPGDRRVTPLGAASLVADPQTTEPWVWQGADGQFSRGISR